MNRPFPWLTVGLFAFLTGAAFALNLGAFFDHSREALSTPPPEPINVNQLLIRPFLLQVGVAALLVLPLVTARAFTTGGSAFGGTRPTHEELRQRQALDELHHERLHATGLFETVDCGDVRMIQRGQRPGFTLEAREPISVVRERFGQDLDRHIPIELRIAGAIHLPHAAFADLSGDVVDAEARAGSESQSRRRGLYKRGGRVVAQDVRVPGARGQWHPLTDVHHSNKIQIYENTIL